MPGLAEFPQVKIHAQDISSDQNIWDLNWARNGIKFIFQHYLNGEKVNFHNEIENNNNSSNNINYNNRIFPLRF